MPIFNSYDDVSSAEDDDLLLIDRSPYTGSSVKNISVANLLSGVGGGHTVTLPLSTADIKGLASSITLVAAQGSNTIIIPTSIILRYIYNSQAFDVAFAPIYVGFDPSTSLINGAPEGGAVGLTGLFGTGSKTIFNTGLAFVDYTNGTDADAVNQPLLLMTSDDALAGGGGNGSAIVTLTYVIFNTVTGALS